MKGMAISPSLSAKAEMDSFLFGIELHKVVKENKALLYDDWKGNILLFGVEQYFAAEICSALIFLHSNKPLIIHGNLKPTKVFFNGNYVCKLAA
ncbi:hypothetical protein PVL29_018144 [Vitis rotundifolia]|uniref:RING-type E3 ubiquitin transferase n=1 Tax=Vitis rotundifolia TaxID=103349 RepID=A0AA38Z548_VITRO|nr:hypothetical protein PVL29_018144 [Vitis rotundifolia]